MVANYAAMILEPCSRFLTRCSRSCTIRFCFRNNANVAVPPTVSAVSKKEPHENIARIAKRYLDDNMQQAWINPRLISMVSEYKYNDYARAAHVCLSAPIIPVRKYYREGTRTFRFGLTSRPTN